MQLSDKSFCELYNQFQHIKSSMEKELKLIEGFCAYLKNFYLEAESEEEKRVVFTGDFAIIDTRKNPGAAENPHPSPEGKTYILD